MEGTYAMLNCASWYYGCESRRGIPIWRNQAGEVEVGMRRLWRACRGFEKRFVELMLRLISKPLSMLACQLLKYAAPKKVTILGGEVGSLEIDSSLI